MLFTLFEHLVSSVIGGLQGLSYLHVPDCIWVFFYFVYSWQYSFLFWIMYLLQHFGYLPIIKYEFCQISTVYMKLLNYLFCNMFGIVFGELWVNWCQLIVDKEGHALHSSASPLRQWCGWNSTQHQTWRSTVIGDFMACQLTTLSLFNTDLIR